MIVLVANEPAASAPPAAAAQQTWTGAYGEWPPTDPIPHPDGTVAYRWYRISDATMARIEDCMVRNQASIGRDRVMEWCARRGPLHHLHGDHRDQTRPMSAAANGAVVLDKVRTALAEAAESGEARPGRPALVRLTGATDHQVRRALAELLHRPPALASLATTSHHPW
ncbi:hypothetical protein [Alloactinosynnema sp. L-07]|uniref:hypothetical protein n=1 Tax=Alloactinosynnema sp. L-07 TaxID=1653480 RepID=UPI00065F0600|nr:hypothetical protein [Alloactinosynnema sp. L-07]CRK59183.1 hypothetical protein [Alloactinosynnema sp. L-07]